MKHNKIYMFILSALLPLLWLACSKETPVGGINTDPVLEQGRYPITFSLQKGLVSSPKTYAKVTANSEERNVSNLVALVFNANDSKFIGTPLSVNVSNQVGEDTNDTDSKLTGNLDLGNYGSDGKQIKFVLVANMTVSEMSSSLTSLAAEQSKLVTDLTLEDVKGAKISNAPGLQNNFVMVSQYDYSVTLRQNQSQQVGDIKLRRLAARIDIKLGTSPNNAGLTIEQVTVKKSQVKSYLVEKAGQSSGTNLSSSDDKDYSGLSATTHTAYTYENSHVNQTNLEVTLALNGVTLKPLSIPFTGKAIKRNHIYNVTLNRDDKDAPGNNPSDPNPPGGGTPGGGSGTPNITFKVDVNDWSVGTVNYIDDYANTNAAVIAKLTQKQAGWIANANPVTMTVSNHNTAASVTKETQYILADVHGKSTQSKAVVTSGNSWVSVADATTYATAGMKQQFHITVQPNTSGGERVATIEFRNKLEESEKVVLTITQAASASTPTPVPPAAATVPAINSVTEKDASFANDVLPSTVTYNNDQVKTGAKATYFVVNTDVNTDASVLSGNAWLRLTTTGNEVRVTVDANSTTSSRVGVIQIANAADASKTRTLVVTQEAGVSMTQHPKLALEYVAEYNLSINGSDFATTHEYNGYQQGYFNWNEAVQHAMAKNDYHLPTQEEWRGIFADRYIIRFNEVTNISNLSEKINVAGEVNTYTADYKSDGKGTAYAIKFKDNSNSLRTAYRYRLLGTNGGSDYRVVVDAIYLGNNTSKNINNINTLDWSASGVVTREFHASGRNNSSNSLIENGVTGNFWSATEENDTYAWGVNFSSTSVNVDNTYHQHKTQQRFTVRLFKGQGPTVDAPEITSIKETAPNFTAQPGSTTTTVLDSDNTDVLVLRNATYMVFTTDSFSKVSSNQSWVTATETSSKPGREFRVVIAANNTNYDREATLTLTNPVDVSKTTTITIRQIVGRHPKLALEYPKTSLQYQYKKISTISTRLDSSHHLPYIDEWRGILPANGFNFTTQTSVSQRGVSESIRVRGTVKTYTADYMSDGNGVGYAVKFKGDNNYLRTAYRYQFVGTKGQSGYKLVIEVIYLGSKNNIDVSQLHTLNWNSPDAKRELPALGWYRYNYSDYYVAYDWGSYAAVTLNKTKDYAVQAIYFYEGGAQVNDKGGTAAHYHYNIGGIKDDYPSKDKISVLYFSDN